MLPMRSRLGSLLWTLITSTYRNAAAGVCAVVVTGVAVVGTTSAYAQQSAGFTPQQCQSAVSVANSLIEKNTGRISAQLVDSFRRFRQAKCDMNTDWKLMTKEDERVFGEFRVLLIALRSAADRTAGIPQPS